VAITLTVVVPTHNPDLDRLNRVVGALRAQSLRRDCWELLVVDNASTKSLQLDMIEEISTLNAHIVREPKLGLTAARRRGFRESRGDYVVLVDDDNVLAPDYLGNVVQLFSAHEHVGAFGGRVLPAFSSMPPSWVADFQGLLACRDLGDSLIVSTGDWNAAQGRNTYPACAPIGAGMAIRRTAIEPWISGENDQSLPDRRAEELTSGGDNDIVFAILKAGWGVGYSPDLCLTHLIPAFRCERRYLARLNRGIAKSWIRVLGKYDACPWPPIPSWTVPLRKAKAWFTYRAWSGPGAFVRWQGACGHFEGRAALFDL